MANLETDNLYEMNKLLIRKSEKILKGKALSNKINRVVIPYFNEKIPNESYFMLLCHEKRDYTVFNICSNQKSNESKANESAEALKECLLVRGAIYGIDRTEDGVALEIWIEHDEDKQIACYYLFPYTQAVVTI